ncbi:MAG: RNA polymerase sigma-70 factor, ECF subfamily [Parcubacteria group bacterium LiPW_30]|nr:MAG: RNA polymerase sigma-70 factor, ECF subfamily [Parcubacteria group bacterium LiPW_30]
MIDGEDEKIIKELPDEEVLSRSIEKPDYFAEIVDRYQGALLRKANSMLRNEESAEDVVQETFVKIYANAGRFKEVPGATFKSWAYKILVNTCLTFLKKSKREREIFVALDPELAEVIADPMDLSFIDKKFSADHLMSLVSRLSETLRRTVMWHTVDDLSYQEIAEKEGVTEGVVRARMHRAKKELKKINESFGV